jgi:hypothetical protein
MKTFLPLLAIFLAAATPAPAEAIPLRFEHVPLGNVVRIISARFRFQVTVTAQSTAPITGDFSGLTPRQALAAAAAQAGLEVVALGADDASGFLLKKGPGLHPPGAKSGDTKINSTDPDPVGPADAKIALAIAAARRAALLKQRAQLQQNAVRLEVGGADPAP